LGVAALHCRLAAVDPAAAQRILVNDLRRIVRALEVFHHTGRPISDWQRQFATPAKPRPKAACLLRPRQSLVARIHERIDAMLAVGWIDEVRALEARPSLSSTGVAQMVGYREIADHLSGRLSFEEMRAAIQIRTRQFAKRQMTWFRHLEELTFFDLEEANRAPSLHRGTTVERLVEFFTSK
jgi:tRNA dimethylallyltransferase